MLAGMPTSQFLPPGVARTGRSLYEHGCYVDAAPLLQGEAEDGNALSAEYFAEVCHCNLDGKPRNQGVAAAYYILAAELGNGDVLSYLATLADELVDPAVSIEVKVQLLSTKL